MRRTRGAARWQGWPIGPLGLLALAVVLRASGEGVEGPIEEELRRHAIVALAAAEARAVIRSPQGDLRLIGPGDELLDGRIEVREIRAERLVIRAGVRTLWWTPLPRPDRSEVRVLDPRSPVELVRRPEPVARPQAPEAEAPPAAASNPRDEGPPPSVLEGGPA